MLIHTQNMSSTFELHRAIRSSLENNPEADILYTRENRHQKDMNREMHKVEYVVAPKQGLYSAAPLDDFMLSLVTEITPVDIEHFRQQGDILWFGSLCFERKSGQSVTDSTGEESLLVRRVIVKPFPSAELARDVIEGGFYLARHGIRVADLSRYCISHACGHGGSRQQ